MKNPFHDSNGEIIPADHFENDPGAPVPLDAFMSAADIARFNAATMRLRDRLRRLPPSPTGL